MVKKDPRIIVRLEDTWRKADAANDRHGTPKSQAALDSAWTRYRDACMKDSICVEPECFTAPVNGVYCKQHKG
ncbi:MAG TPA: hypothetical protein VIP77_05560 [Jiangellaceae bacterium]